MHKINVFSLSNIGIYGDEGRDRMLVRDLDGIYEDLAIMANTEIASELA
jgi:hypothetical protein